MAQRLCALVVDDHTMFREFLAQLLRDRGMTVTEAATAQAGISLAARLMPDLILLDIGLPGINGIQAAYRFAAKSRKSKVLILSQHDDPEYVLEAFSGAKVAGYLVKTDPASELTAAIAAVCAGKRYVSPTVAPVVLAQIEAPARNQNPLSRREREILKLIAEGATAKAIGVSLGISSKTVQAHRASLTVKLGLRSTAQLVRYAIKHKLVALD